MPKRSPFFPTFVGMATVWGAQTGLAEILSSAGFPVALYNQDALSEKFCFMAHYDEITVCDDAAPLPDVCIAVDCATLERIGKLPQAFLARPWINIDHHVSNNSFGALNIVEADASSTCEIQSAPAMALDAGRSSFAGSGDLALQRHQHRHRIVSLSKRTGHHLPHRSQTARKWRR